VADDETPKAPDRTRRGRADDRPAEDSPPEDGNRHDLSAAGMARRAAALVAAFTEHEPESVVSVERRDGEWQIGVEVVELRRIPDTADILAIYEVRLDHDGELVSYRRTLRYARSQLSEDGFSGDS
jgi:hypothetical protein